MGCASVLKIQFRDSLDTVVAEIGTSYLASYSDPITNGSIVELSINASGDDLRDVLGAVLVDSKPLLTQNVEQSRTRAKNWHVLADNPAKTKVTGQFLDAFNNVVKSFEITGCVTVEGTTYTSTGRTQTLRVYRADITTDRGSL